jgi:outer membrane lipoprotein-sorting protein
MKWNLIIISIFILSVKLFADEKGEQIAKKCFDLKDSDTEYSSLTMVLIDKNGDRKIRKIEMYSKRTKEGTNTFMNFLEPSDVKGTKFLTIGYENGNDDQRLYLPALKKTRKIASSGKGGDFMGSDLSYYDMENRSYGDAAYKYIKEEKYNGMICNVIEMVPTDKDAPYSKSITWISKENNFIYKQECYDKDGTLLKIIAMVEVKDIKGILTPLKIAVDNVQKNHKTLLQFDGIKMNEGVSDDVFTVQNLEK